MKERRDRNNFLEFGLSNGENFEIEKTERKRFERWGLRVRRLLADLLHS